LPESLPQQFLLLLEGLQCFFELALLIEGESLSQSLVDLIGVLAVSLSEATANLCEASRVSKAGVLGLCSLFREAGADWGFWSFFSAL
jgi:hypothetical protein